MTDRSDHWQGIYEARPSTELSWYQQEPGTSLRLIERAAQGKSVAFIDLGAGASQLVDRLIARDYADLTVVDISDRALAEVRARLGSHASAVTFVHADITSWVPPRTYDIWHDRAVFHFLTDEPDRAHYVEVASRGVLSGGAIVLGTFAEDGPTQCSGLPVRRYGAKELATTFSEHFSLVEHEREEHVTPTGVAQAFTWVVLRRR